MKAAALALAVAASLASAKSDEIAFTATSVNVAEAGMAVRIKLTRWSTDEERTPIVNALTAPAAPAPARSATAGGPGARGARGGARGRGGRGPAAPLTPIAAFAAALGRAPTLGYVWTNDITGYSIKYAWHAPRPDGSERIVLASDRRLGAYTDVWKTTQAAETDYTFTLIELHVGPGGLLEGKTSLTGKIALDNDAKTVALESYDAAPVVLKNGRR